MTKRHFEGFAAIIREDLDMTRSRFPNDYERTFSAACYAASTFARIASLNNPRFDYERFMQACGLREGK